MPTARPHADLIRAYADGHTIQLYFDGDWIDITEPRFHADCRYRVKPTEPQTLRVALIRYPSPTPVVITHPHYETVEASPHFDHWITEPIAW